ncbi:3-deoxy-7-phosphoheptulonate synthase [Thermoplasma sp.]|uniref:3-deoxy-7-phosphoheptulonate synthase n=1 Tax=Thermoplasma sp. TaxID=1973142 RepID=UPI00262C8255|nr:3-deoxy-7-phosphoheptulonate synthase [Thermoplasma sp.]
MIVIAKDENDKRTIQEDLEKRGSEYHMIKLYDNYVFMSDGGDEEKDRLYSRKFRKKSIIDVSGVRIGEGLKIAAGPCSVENEEMILDIARSVKAAGADMIRGGAFKPRTSPYSFQGLGEDGIKYLVEAKEETGLPIVTEIMNPAYYRYFDGVDMLQVGSRNAQNFDLLRFLGKQKKPVLLKNGMGNTAKEWLETAEYILSGGNGNVVLCYRGVRGIENSTRFTMNVGSIIYAKSETHLPICADPSHASGRRDFVESMALASVAAGADMLEIEVHNDPDRALSDADQQITPFDLKRIIEKARALKRELDAWDKQ